MVKPFFSVVTPTYNRANLIGRVFESLRNQMFTNFEWVVIDDGSTDDTESVILSMKECAKFDIKYIRTRNQGKANALNESLKHCSGLLYLVFDSDDWCDSDALDVFYEEYIILKKRSDFEEYGALSALKRYQSNAIVGDNYDKIDKYKLTYIDRINRNIQGDKWECLILIKMKNLSYPVAKDEKYMAPSYIWLKLADIGLKTVFINKSLSTIEYQPDGISKNNLKHRLSSLDTTIKYYKDSYGLKDLKYTKASKYYANFIRFSLHGKRNFKISTRYLPFMSLGILMYLKDISRE